MSHHLFVTLLFSLLMLSPLLLVLLVVFWRCVKDE